MLLLGTVPIAFVCPTVAQASSAPMLAVSGNDPVQNSATATKASTEEVFSTGVAKGRDRLDSATSTSSFKGSDVEELGAHSLVEVLRTIPGIRAETGGGEGNGSYSIRGLPLASNGSKFMQFQEDGLPVLEFGDFFFLSPDIFMRADFNLAQIETIRGGSASTFASNSPGGVINLISKTGDVKGGAIQATLGLNYGEHRVDFDYGNKISDTLRYHIGGFYRQGEGPRHLGYDAYRGGQLKFNITKQFADGYVRLNAKLLDDRAPAYQATPMMVTGTNANPTFANVPNFDVRTDSLLSRNITSFVSLNGDNKVTHDDVRDGMHPVLKSFGLEAQFDLSGWTFSEKFRFSDVSGTIFTNQPLVVGPAAALVPAFGGPGAHLTYASGPNAGMVVANPSALNGNGLLVRSIIAENRLNSVDNLTNDFRATHVWNVGDGALTATAGFYKSVQWLKTVTMIDTFLSDVVGGGNASLFNLTTAAGIPLSQDGVAAYGLGFPNGAYHRAFDVRYNINAPYGSLNYHIGKLAIGGSLRYDAGSARGAIFGGELGGGRIGSIPYDINGDGMISVVESDVSVLPLSNPAPVHYHYHYLSYSAGVNFRVAEPLALFGRYSRGGRAAADRILFTPAVSTIDGSLGDPADGFDSVRQAEFGLKYRKSNVTLNVTGFLASTGDRNLQLNSAPDGSVQLVRIVRRYNAKGVELEGAVRHGAFSLTANATYTSAKITSDLSNPALNGNVPRHQPSFIFAAMPQYTTEKFTVGASIIGTTSSFTQDTNQLKLPAYTTVNAFVQIRPVERVQLMLNVNNLFDAMGLVDVTQASILPGGVVYARAITGRTISTSVRLSF